MSNLLIKTLPIPADYKLTKAELKEFFQPKVLKSMIPNGARFVEADEMVLEGAPAGFMVFDMTQQRLDIKRTIRMTQFVVIHGNVAVFLQFTFLRTPAGHKSLDSAQEIFLPIYRAIANTYVWNDRYR